MGRQSTACELVDDSRVRRRRCAPNSFTNEQIRRNRVWGSMATGGSRSIRDSQEYLRRAGATAREMLIAAAARKWKVPGSECDAENGVITHMPSGRKLRFGQVAQAASKIEPPGEVRLKIEDWNLSATGGAAGHSPQSHGQAALRHDCSSGMV